MCRRGNQNWTHSKGIVIKGQKYNYSCFAACLQIAMKNMGLGNDIKSAEVEDDYNNEFLQYKNKDLDSTAPEYAFLTDFFWNYKNISILDRGVINTNALQKGNLSIITDHLNNRTYCALIGFINSVGGHATMVLKTPNGLFFVDPTMPYVEEITNYDPILEGGIDNRQAFRIKPYVTMERIYVIHS